MMKLEIARGLFLLAALSLASLAAAAWHEPGTQVISSGDAELGEAAENARSETAVRPDNDLLLFIFSLSQGMHPNG